MKADPKRASQARAGSSQLPAWWRRRGSSTWSKPAACCRIWASNSSVGLLEKVRVPPICGTWSIVTASCTASSCAGPFRTSPVIQEYHNADVLVAPSVVAGNGDRDGVPNVILEAMAAGCPVIASDAGSIAEVIRDGETGLLVPQRDPTAIASRVSGLWEDPGLQAALVQQAHQFVRTEYEPERWSRMLYDRFKSIGDGG